MFNSRVLNVSMSHIIKKEIAYSSLFCKPKLLSTNPSQFNLPNNRDSYLKSRPFSLFSYFSTASENIFTLQNNKVKHRYYAVGAPIEELKINWQLRIKPKEISRSELEASLFMHQSPIKLFVLYDHAKEYAHSLRCKADAFTIFPKMPLNKSKLWPVFTLELAIATSKHKIETETHTYIDRYFDENSYFSTGQKQTTVNFYNIHVSEISKNSIIRAEFYKSKITPIELQINMNANIKKNTR